MYGYVIFVCFLVCQTCLVSCQFFPWSNFACQFTECCNDDNIPYDIEKLKELFSKQIFGQPLASDVINILSAHKEVTLDMNKRSKKALVLSLHGWPGVGKNFVASMIAEALYKYGMKSSFVKLFMGTMDFDCNDKDEAKKQLIQSVREVVKECPRSLIILDEIHEMCSSVLDAIKPMFDHYHEVDGVDYRQSIFIFISNTGGKEIASNLLELYDSGIKRSEVEFRNFEPDLRRVAYSTGGFERAAAIANHLIDHYIPFLPLEQHHVEKCALAEFHENGVTQPTKRMLAEALSVIVYVPADRPIFANNGCKRLSKQVPFIIEKYKSKKKIEL